MTLTGRVSVVQGLKCSVELFNASPRHVETPRTSARRPGGAQCFQAPLSHSNQSSPVRAHACEPCSISCARLRSNGTILYRRVGASAKRSWRPDPRPEPASISAFRRVSCASSATPDRVGAIRPRARGVHRRDQGTARPV
jgi:hypothetical protein